MSHIGCILSTGEEPIKQLPTCLACYRQGHTRSSRNCPLKLQALIATQNQILLEMDIVARQPLAPTVPAASIVQAEPIAPAVPVASIVQAEPIAPVVPVASIV